MTGNRTHDLCDTGADLLDFWCLEDFWCLKILVLSTSTLHIKNGPVYTTSIFDRAALSF